MEYIFKCSPNGKIKQLNFCFDFERHQSDESASLEIVSIGVAAINVIRRM